MDRRQFLTHMTALAGLASAPVLLAQVKDVNDAINKAGRQRMLSQRMAKCYLALGQGVVADAADRNLAASMALFDRQLVELKAFAPTPDVKATYAQLEALWSEYKAALVGAVPSKAGADAVLALAARVLASANQGTQQLEGVSAKPVGRLVNISGRQRMLSQRMAALYLGASWGVQAAAAGSELNKARDEFLTAHEVLKRAPEATDAIRAELQLAETQFTFFDAALRTLRPGAGDAPSMTNVFTTSERILQVMDNVTGLYARLG